MTASSRHRLFAVEQVRKATVGGVAAKAVEGTEGHVLLVGGAERRPAQFDAGQTDEPVEVAFPQLFGGGVVAGFCSFSSQWVMEPSAGIGRGTSWSGSSTVADSTGDATHFGKERMTKPTTPANPACRPAPAVTRLPARKPTPRPPRHAVPYKAYSSPAHSSARLHHQREQEEADRDGVAAAPSRCCPARKSAFPSSTASCGYKASTSRYGSGPGPQHCTTKSMTVAICCPRVTESTCRSTTARPTVGRRARGDTTR